MPLWASLVEVGQNGERDVPWVTPVGRDNDECGCLALLDQMHGEEQPNCVAVVTVSYRSIRHCFQVVTGSKRKGKGARHA